MKFTFCTKIFLLFLFCSINLLTKGRTNTFGKSRDSFNYLTNKDSLTVDNNVKGQESLDSHENKGDLSLTIKSQPIMFNDGTYWNDNTSLNGLRLSIMFGAIAAGDVVGYLRLKNFRRNWKTTSFHTMDFFPDLKKYEQMDKMGHFLHAYFATGLFSSGYRWSGLSGVSSVWLGAVTGWLWMLQIEIGDAFFDKWGFSWGDLLANTAGNGFSLLQQLYPDALGGIQPKISYHKSDALKEHRYDNGATAIIDDYEGMTFWLAVNVYHYLPKNLQAECPVWLAPLGIAVGHAAKEISDDPRLAYREIFLGLDYDLRKIPFGDESGLIRFLKTELNIIRLPLPAVKLTPTGVWYGLYF